MTGSTEHDNQEVENGISLVDDPYGLGTLHGAESDPSDPERVPELDGMAEDAPDDGEHLPSFREIGSHLDELRRRVIIAFAAFIPFFGIGLLLYKTLWNLIIMPLDRAAPHLLRFQALGPSDGLVMAMRIAFAFALFLSMPIWLGQIWSFVAPGLTGRERRWLYLSLGSGTVLFIIGASLAYLVGIPLALEFLLPFNQSLAGWENAFTGHDYVDFVITCCFGFGIAFELPLVMLALGWFGILTPELLRTYWRPVILIIFILAAILTPPDPFTQMLMAVPMIGLFTLGYYLVKWTSRQ